MATFSTFQICNAFGFEYGRFREWLKFIGVKKRAVGRGGRTAFDLDEVYMLMLFVYLIERGFSRQDASERVKDVAEYIKASRIKLKKEWQPSHIAFIRRDSGPKAVLLDPEWFKTKTLNDLVGDADFSDSVVINFESIISKVNKKLLG